MEILKLKLKLTEQEELVAQINEASNSL